MATEKESFIIYKSFYEPIKILSDKQLGRLFRALFDYQIENKADVEPDILMAFSFFKNQMDIDERKYDKVVERNRSNGSKGGRPSKEKNPKNPVGFNKPKKADNDNVNVNENVNEFNPPLSPQGESGGKSKNFIKPTIAQVQDEINRLGYVELDAEEFWHFYESKNWFVGKNKMKSFSSALVTWHKSSLSKMNTKHKAREKKLPSELIREMQEKQAKRDEEYIDTEANYG